MKINHPICACLFCVQLYTKVRSHFGYATNPKLFWVSMTEIQIYDPTLDALIFTQFVSLF